jgi:hypothetical protein
MFYSPNVHATTPIDFAWDDDYTLQARIPTWSRPARKTAYSVQAVHTERCQGGTRMPWRK